jgi:hypothetical protein
MDAFTRMSASRGVDGHTRLEMNEHDKPGRGRATETMERRPRPWPKRHRDHPERARPDRDRVGRRATVSSTWNDGWARVRRVRRMGNQHLPFLYDVRSEAVRRDRSRLAADDRRRPHRGHGGRRGRSGGDFLLPAVPWRNWNTRWQQLRMAQDALAVLPIDVEVGRSLRVADGHNRVGLRCMGARPPSMPT